jgi:hypothetical protein
MLKLVLREVEGVWLFDDPTVRSTEFGLADW